MKAFAPVLAGFKRLLEGQYGEPCPALARYGYAPAKPRTQSAESKAAAAAKAKATRAAKKAALAAVGTAPAAGDAGSGDGDCRGVRRRRRAGRGDDEVLDAVKGRARSSRGIAPAGPRLLSLGLLRLDLAKSLADAQLVAQVGLAGRC